MRSALCSVALLFALPAHATWRSAQITGTPRDVEIVDAGMAVVASTTAMTLFSGTSAGIAQAQTFAGAVFSATWRPPGCLIGMSQTSALVVFEGSCPSTVNPLTGGANAGGRFRQLPGGALYAYGWLSAGSAARLERAGPTGGAVTADWNVLGPITNQSLPAAPISVMAGPNGAEYGAWGWQIGGVESLEVFVDGGSLRAFGPMGVRDVSLFSRGGVAAALVISDGGLVLRNPDLATGVFSPADAPPRAYTTASVTGAGGNANGMGFGMLTVGNQIYGLVPNPNAIGDKWVLRTEDAGFLGALVRATCTDPSFCVAITSTNGAANVFAYFNEFPPTANPGMPSVPAGGFSSYTLDAGDPDGDPIWVTWADGGFIWDGGDPRSITLVGTAPGVCGASVAAADLIAIVSDGYAPHEQRFVIPVTVNSAAPIASLIASPPTLDLRAGGDAGFVQIINGDSGCPLPPALTYSSSGGNLVIVPGDGGVTIIPPPNFCNATPQQFIVNASGGSADASITVTLNPWGPPYDPVFSNLNPTQPAGTDAGYFPTAASTHFCEGTAGFPTAPLVWMVGGALPPGVSVVPSGTSLTVYSTNECVGGLVTATAKRQVLTTLELSSGSATLNVTLVPNLSPITPATPFDAGFFYDRAMSKLTGNFSTGASCEADRNLRATVEISIRSGAQIASDNAIAVPGAWSLDVPGGCEGGSFDAVAYLTDAGTLGPRTTFSFDPLPVAPRVPSLTVGRVPLTCLGGAQGSLELDVLPTDCAAQKYQWSQIGGPALVVAPDGGAIVSYATGTQDLQAQAGQELSWSITATTGPSSSATAIRTVRLVPDRFVEITHRTDVPLAREEEELGVEVTLRNTTPCAVTGVVLRETLAGLRLIPGSVRVAGARTELNETGGILEVPDLSLLGDGSVKITYLAKARLLSAARPGGFALFAGADVTLPPPGPVATGCGCGSSGSGIFALLALLGALVRSRRRSG